MKNLPARSNRILLAVSLLASVLFLLATHYRLPPTSRVATLPEGQIVITAPLQVAIYAGDRFLAADLETMRVAAIGPSEEERLAAYRIRAQTVVAQLNPCQEDNAYLANAMLSWGGAVDEGNDILQRATDCRYWDEIPPFFLGFNRYFFYRDVDGARKFIEIAAARSEKNRSALKQISIVMASKKLADEKMAVEYLRSERDKATDKGIAKMLERRLTRLEGLITLREAQSRFEKRFGKPLSDPNELLISNILESFPQDPMGLGYQFIDGHFRLRPHIINGRELL